MNEKRFISYARASQDRTGEELSVERQLEDQRAYVAARPGWTIVKELVDNDVSAAGKVKRPAFETALRMVDASDADGILATDMSRLTRGKARDEVRILELGVRVDLVLAFVRAPELDLSSAAGRLTASILIAAARHEIEQKSERQARAALQAAQQGRRAGGRRPFGYEADGMTVREVEAEALRDAYAAVLTGVSLGGVARDWNARGLYTPQPRRDGSPSAWTSQTVRPVLLNPRYAGLRYHIDGRARETMNPVKARLANIVGAAQWPAIVLESTWRAAVVVLADPARQNPARGAQALLTGVALCGVCGSENPSTVHAGGGPARNGREGYRTYRCRATSGHVARAAAPVDQFVEALLVERLSREDARDLLVDHRRVDVNQLRERVVELRGRRRSLLGLAADGVFTDAEVRAEAARLSRQITEVEAELTDAGRVNLLGPIVAAPDVRAALRALGTERLRTVVDTLMVVRLHPPGRGTRKFRPETVEVEWRE